MPVEIPLNRGFITIVDDGDAERVLHRAWTVKQCHPDLYATSSQTPTGAPACRMHRYILGITARAILVDHWDGNGLNNQRNNLRITNHAGNSRNRLKRSGWTSSRFKGVSLSPLQRKWAAALKGKLIGTFSAEVDAAHAYDRAARDRHDPFFTYNFPLPGERSALTGLIEPFPESISP